MYQCGRCGLTRASSQEPMGLAMPQCKCAWEFVPPVAPQRPWVGLTDEEIDRRLCPTKNEFEIDDRFWDGVDWAKAQIKGENT